jgi:hypothetical protein
MTERHALGGLQTPVGDGSTLTLRCLHENTELSFLASLDRMAEHIALASISKLNMAQGTRVVNIKHIVATNVSDTASSRPGVGARVAKSPDLNELLAGTDLGSINDGVPNEVRVEAFGSGFRSRDGNSFGLDWHLRLHTQNRPWLLLHGLHRIDKKITNGNLLLLDLGLR